jgi:hypothetical protein
MNWIIDIIKMITVARYFISYRSLLKCYLLNVVILGSMIFDHLVILNRTKTNLKSRNTMFGLVRQFAELEDGFQHSSFCFSDTTTCFDGARGVFLSGSISNQYFSELLY